MKVVKKLQCWALGLAVAGIFCPQLANAAQPAAPSRVAQQKMVDVALHDGGVFVGQVMDSQGAAKANATVVLAQREGVVATVKTDAEGRFVVRGVRAGVYQVQAEQTTSVYRLWAPQTAPPSARPAALMVSNDNVVLGQGTDYGPAIRGAVAGGLITGGTYWALDHNPTGS